MLHDGGRISEAWHQAAVLGIRPTRLLRFRRSAAERRPWQLGAEAGLASGFPIGFTGQRFSVVHKAFTPLSTSAYPLLVGLLVGSALCI